MKSILFPISNSSGNDGNNSRTNGNKNVNNDQPVEHSQRNWINVPKTVRF